jgi:hypothetical protein
MNKHIPLHVITTGSIGRKLKRKAKHQNKIGQIGVCELGPMKSRQERKSIAEQLKVKFIPRYNTQFILKKVWTENLQDEEGNKIPLNSKERFTSEYISIEV